MELLAAPIPVGTVELETLRFKLQTYLCGAPKDRDEKEGVVRSILMDPRLESAVERARRKTRQNYVSISLLDSNGLAESAWGLKGEIENELKLRA